MDLYLLKRRFNIVQVRALSRVYGINIYRKWDLYFHHFTGLFLMPWFIVRGSLADPC